MRAALPPRPGPPVARHRNRGSWVYVPSGGQRRFALVHVPPAGSAGKPMPLVLALHGFGGNARFMETYTGLSRLSDRRGFMVAYPAASGNPSRWNIAGTAGGQGDDVAFIAALLDTLESRLCIDTGRLYATGVSNGGGMVARLGCDLSDRLDAIAPVAGGYSSLPPCAPARPLSVLEIHGTQTTSCPTRAGAGKGRQRAGVRARVGAARPLPPLGRPKHTGSAASCASIGAPARPVPRCRT